MYKPILTILIFTTLFLSINADKKEKRPYLTSYDSYDYEDYAEDLADWYCKESKLCTHKDEDRIASYILTELNYQSFDTLTNIELVAYITREYYPPTTSYTTITPFTKSSSTTTSMTDTTTTTSINSTTTSMTDTTTTTSMNSTMTTTSITSSTSTTSTTSSTRTTSTTSTTSKNNTLDVDINNNDTVINRSGTTKTNNYLTNVTHILIGIITMLLIGIVLLLIFKKKHIIVKRIDNETQTITHTSQHEYLIPQTNFNNDESSFLYTNTYSYISNPLTKVKQSNNNKNSYISQPNPVYDIANPRANVEYLNIMENPNSTTDYSEYDNAQNDNIMYDVGPLPKRRKSTSS